MGGGSGRRDEPEQPGGTTELGVSGEAHAGAIAWDEPLVTVAGTVGEAEAAPGEAPRLGELARGTAVGRYVVLERVGSGSMGVVYRAYDPELDRRVALKLVVVRGSFKKRAAEVRARLLREAQALARVGHANVIQVFDVGTVDEGLFVAMEYVDGVTLRLWNSEQDQHWRDVVDVFRQAARGLWAAHQADVIHRDFKPDNIMIGHDGRVRVLDFGLARAGGTDSAPVDDEDLGTPRASSFDEELTQHGTIIGTPAYMAPEQHVGGGASMASDQFAFCVALWEALYGARPYGGETHAAIAFSIVHGRLRAPPTERRVPRWLHRLLVRGLQTAPQERFPSMGDLLAELERERATWRRVGIGGIAIATGLVAVLVLPRGDASQPAPCTGAEKRMEYRWNPTRRDEIAGAFEASSFPFAAETWTSAESVVDDWTTRWIAARTEACKATRVYGEQSEALMDLRMACLDRGLTELDALLELYASGDREMVIGAVDAARSLADLDACSDARTLGARTPLPTDPAVRARISGAEADLARLHARATAGALTRIEEPLRAMTETVLALDHPPLTEELMAVRALVQFDTGATKEARASWEEAFRAALVAGDHRDAVFYASKLAFAIGARLNDGETGRFWAVTARALARGVEDDGRLEMSILSAEASMATTTGDYETALAGHRRVLEFWEQHDSSAPDLAIALGNIGAIERQRGDGPLAEELHRRELAVYSTAYGAAHPLTAAAMRHLALALAIQGKTDEALELSEKALAIHRATQGDRNIEVATALDEIGQLLRTKGRLDEAVARHREALEIWRAELGADNPDVAISSMQIGYTLAAQGRHADALEVFDDAGARLLESQGVGHPNLIYVDNAAAKALLALGRPVEARARAERAIASDAATQVDPTLVAESKFLLARALVDAGDTTDRPDALAREAETAYRGDATRWAEDLAAVRAFLARD